MNYKTKTTYSAGGVVLNSQRKVLIVNQNGDSWSLPKGHIDPGEDAFTAAKREIEEESGVNQWNLTFEQELGSYTRYRIGLDGTDDKSELKNITILAFSTGQEELKPIDPHNPEARWVAIDEVETFLTHPKDREFFASIREKL